jgi:hypothetical protein
MMGAGSCASKFTGRVPMVWLVRLHKPKTGYGIERRRTDFECEVLKQERCHERQNRQAGLNSYWHLCGAGGALTKVFD